MEHAITIGDLVKWVLIIGGAVGIIWFIGWVLLVLLNPFSSGH